MRAHPTQTVAESEDNRDLIDLFLKGLAQESTKTQTWAFLPRSLTAAAQRAQNIEAGAHIFGTLSSGSSPSISALQDKKRTRSPGTSSKTVGCGKPSGPRQGPKEKAKVRPPVEKERPRRGEEEAAKAA